MSTARDYANAVREAEAIRKAKGEPAGRRLGLCLEVVARNRGFPLQYVPADILAGAIHLFAKTSGDREEL